MIRTSRTLLLPAILLLAGCPPPCDEVCRKLNRCGLQPAVNRTECSASCDQELTRLQDDDDDDGLAAFNAQRRCLASSSCDGIADATCYDPALFPFESTSPSE